MRKTLTLLSALTYTVLAQTTVDLGRQARNIDFSNSPFTKTFKTGTGPSIYLQSGRNVSEARRADRAEHLRLHQREHLGATGRARRG